MTRFAQLVHEESEYAVVDVSVDTTTVFTGPCILTGIYVNTVLTAQALPIKDGTTTVVSLVASAAVGTSILYPGIRFNTSLIVDPDNAATGSVTVAFRRVNADE